MVFTFLKYLQPTHYFQRLTNAECSVFPIVEVLPEGVISHLKPDDTYQSSHARVYDLSWQAIQSGYVGNTATYSNFEVVPIQDNYHFLRKYFHSAWVFYVLVLRILSFHNPLKEV